MKKILLFIFLFFLLFFLEVYSQGTWVRTQYYDYPMWASINSDSTTVGPLELIVIPNGRIITLMQVNRHHETQLVVIDSTGEILSASTVADHATLSYEDCYSLHATIDNGCVYIKIHDGGGGNVSFYVYRLGSQSTWTKNYYVGNPKNWVRQVSQSCYNTTLVQFMDSIVEFDSVGNYIQNRYPFSGSAQLTHLPDSDFLLCDSSHIKKENFIGSIKWDILTPGFKVSSANSDFIYASSGVQLMKIATQTGSVIWTKPIVSSALSQTSDLGFITIKDSLFCKYDSSAALEWNKIILLPQFGLKCLAEIPGKNYVTGGAWHNFGVYFMAYHGYSPILFSLDSLGGSVIDSTHYYITGNANDNNLLSYADDAAYVAAAMGNSGIARDTLTRYYYEAQSVFGTDWSTAYPCGVNYKYSDVDGNGVVDSLDMQMMISVRSANASPHWQRLAHSSTVPDIQFVFENDSANYTDTIIVDVIAGSSITPTDSIYGISFELGFSNLLPGNNLIESHYEIKPNSFGDSTQNLFLQSWLNNQLTPRLTLMTLCRTDHMNAILYGDTIARLFYKFPYSTTVWANPVQLWASWNAINKDGCKLTMNTISDSLYFSVTTGINSISENKLKLFPSPAIDKLNFIFEDNDEYEVRITNNLGRVIYDLSTANKSATIDVGKLENGVYFVFAKSKSKALKNIFIVQH